MRARSQVDSSLAARQEADSVSARTHVLQISPDYTNNAKAAFHEFRTQYAPNESGSSA
jgi:hypothetical protein